MRTFTKTISVQSDRRDWRYLWLRRKTITMRYYYDLNIEAGLDLVSWEVVK